MTFCLAGFRICGNPGWVNALRARLSSNPMSYPLPVSRTPSGRSGVGFGQVAVPVCPAQKPAIRLQVGVQRKQMNVPRSRHT